MDEIVEYIIALIVIGVMLFIVSMVAGFMVVSMLKDIGVV